MSDEIQTPETIRERGRVWLRGITLVAIGMLLVTDVAMYSMYQTMHSRVVSQDHRIERLQQMVANMIKANQNAEKIQKIKTQVESIDVQVTELTTTLKAEVTVKAEVTAKAEIAAEEASKKKRRR
jgi:hypothetical protein